VLSKKCPNGVLGTLLLFGFLLVAATIPADLQAKESKHETDRVMLQLFEEFSQWYSNLAVKHGRIPKALSGVSPSGRQFIFVMDGLRLGHVERNKLAKFALAQEGATIFAYGSLMAVYNEDTEQVSEQLTVSAGTSEKFIEGTWSVDRNANKSPKLTHIKTIQRDDPQNYPNTWFLTSANPLSSADEETYAKAWGVMLGKVIFRQR
jgi:hypothetical protein